MNGMSHARMVAVQGNIVGRFLDVIFSITHGYADFGRLNGPQVIFTVTDHHQVLPSQVQVLQQLGQTVQLVHSGLKHLQAVVGRIGRIKPGQGYHFFLDAAQQLMVLVGDVVLDALVLILVNFGQNIISGFLGSAIEVIPGLSPIGYPS